MLKVTTFNRPTTPEKHKGFKEIDTSEFELNRIYRARVNRADVMSVKIMRKGEEIPVSKQVREDFKFTGLSTYDFVDWVVAATGKSL